MGCLSRLFGGKSEPAPAEPAEPTAPSAQDLALHQAIEDDDAVQMAQLLEQGADPNAKGLLGYCALVWVALFGQTEQARLLLDYGALVDGAPGADETPLQRAVGGVGNLQLVQLLVEHGASLSPNNDGSSLLQEAATGGSVPILEYLLSIGAPYVASALEPSSPLELAVSYACREAALFLLPHDEAWPVVHRAALTGDEAVLRHLLAEGVDPSLADGQQSRPLHAAAVADRPDAVRLLLAHGADRDALDSLESTALHHAAAAESIAAMETLLGAGALLEVRDCLGYTPLGRAAHSASAAALRCLIEHGADVNAVADEGRTALHIAASYANVELVEALLAHRADPNQRNDDGQTPLHVLLDGAAPNDEQTQDCLRLLLSHGADRAARDKDGAMPRDLAEASGCADLVAIMAEA